MRSPTFTSGIVAASSIAVLGLAGGPALAVEVPPADAVTAETTETTEEDTTTTDATDQLLDEVDSTVETTAETISETGDSAPEPVGSTTDGAADTLTDTSQEITDAVRQAVGTSDGSPDPEPGSGGDGNTQGAGGGTSTAPAPSSTGATNGSLLAGGGAPVRVPDRIALDGFRRTSGFSDSGPAFPVVDDPVLEPAFAPPTTRQVVEPVAAGPLPLRAVALEILVAAALLVLATGGLVAELGPERA